jgi:hypothetical protein
LSTSITSEEAALAVDGSKARVRAVAAPRLVPRQPLASEFGRRRLGRAREAQHVGVGEQGTDVAQMRLRKRDEPNVTHRRYRPSRNQSVNSAHAALARHPASAVA